MYMKVLRFGYYKCLKDKDKLNQFEINRKDLENLITYIIENQFMD